jgi:hypothetical protein
MESLKPEYFALLGILLGWVLSSLSATIKFRNDRRSDLSMAVSRLLPELSNIETLREATEGFKDTSEDWADYERTRVGLWRRHGQFFQNDGGTDWNDIVDRVAKHKPIIAIKIRRLIHLGKKIATNELPGSAASSPDAYVKLLSALEVAHIGLIKELEKVVRRLSWSGGLGLGISFERYMLTRGGGKRLRQRNSEFLRKFHLDVWEDFKPPEEDKQKDK